MFAFKSLIVFALPLLAVANPLAVRNDPATNCNTGTLQCCNQTKKTGDVPGLGSLLGLLGLTDLLDALVGLNCNPITGIGLGSTTCQQQTVCCNNNNFNSNNQNQGFSLINIDCSPVNLIL